MQQVGTRTILTCAVTGNAPVHREHPRFPITPAEIANSAVLAAKAGAAIVHLHVRDPNTGLASREPGLFKETVERIRNADSDVIINLTAGLGGLFMPDPGNEARGLPESDVIGVEERVAHLEMCRPDIASLDITTGNQAEGEVEFVYLNTTRTLRAMARRFKELNVKPELEVFSAGDIEFGKALGREGLLAGPPLYQFVLGVRWGAPADSRTVIYMRDLLPEGSVWAALGIGQLQMRILAQAALLGGNCRVGLEDNLYLRRGIFATNEELVQQARIILEGIGCTLATPTEARLMLGLS